MKQGIDKNLIITRIEELRKQRGISRQKLAELADISYYTLRNTIRGNCTPELYTIQCICRGLGISVREFFTTREFLEHELDPEERLQYYWSMMSKHERDITLIFMEKVVNKEE